MLESDACVVDKVKIGVISEAKIKLEQGYLSATVKENGQSLTCSTRYAFHFQVTVHFFRNLIVKHTSLVVAVVRICLTQVQTQTQITALRQLINLKGLSTWVANKLHFVQKNAFYGTTDKLQTHKMSLYLQDNLPRVRVAGHTAVVVSCSNFRGPLEISKFTRT